MSEIVVGHCPLDYCVPGEVNFTLTDTDSQCALNRTGTMCGGCQSGLSLTFGSNKCERCPNSFHVALVIPFAFAGFILVVFLMVMDLTVSNGTINGLFFYANVVKTSESIFFPDTIIPVLSQFISWLNLDLDIETCFYNGMTAYGKVGLQFVFPVYIWFVIITIAVLCHYSTWLSRKIGSNIVKVLATLILLSYTKLIRTVALVMNRTSLTYESGGVRHLWYTDGNVDYLSTWQHILLFATALGFLVLAIPYTIVLMTTLQIEKYLTRVKIFSNWWLNFKPFFDAYNGTYKSSCQYWTGLLLLVRIALVLIVTLTSNETVVLSFIASTSVALLSLMVYYGGVYQKKHLDLLECWSLINLTLLSSLTRDYKEVGFYISVSLMLTCSTGVLVFHVLTRLAVIDYIKNKLWNKTYILEDVAQDVENDHHSVNLNVTHSEVVIEREPLLFPDSADYL